MEVPLFDEHEFSKKNDNRVVYRISFTRIARTSRRRTDGGLTDVYIMYETVLSHSWYLYSMAEVRTTRLSRKSRGTTDILTLQRYLDLSTAGGASLKESSWTF